MASSLALPAFAPNLPLVPVLPVIGSMLDFRRDRLALHERASALGPIARFDLVWLPIYAVADAEIAQEILVDKADAFTKGRGLSVFLRPLLGEGLLTAEGEVH